MLAYSDNYKHNNLIYSQVVLMDVTTNGSTILKNPEAGKTWRKQTNIPKGGCVQGLPPLFLHNLLPAPTQVFQGWSGKQGKHTPQTQIIRKQNAHEPRILYFSVKMAVPPGGKDDLVLTCERFIILSNEIITGAVLIMSCHRISTFSVWKIW